MEELLQFGHNICELTLDIQVETEQNQERNSPSRKVILKLLSIQWEKSGNLQHQKPLGSL